MDAPYALPPDGLGQRRVTDRKYRGLCRATEYLAAAVDNMQSNRKAIYALVDELEGLSDRTRREVVRFIDEFFADLDSPKSFEKNVSGACRKF